MNPTRIAFVTSRFHELQGLQRMHGLFVPVSFGATIVVARFAPALAWAAVLTFGVLAAAWMVLWHIRLRERIGRYYASRFGRVNSAPIIESGGDGIFYAVVGNGFLTMVDAPHAARIVLAAALIGAWPAWVAVRDWPFRAHWLVCVPVALLTAVDVSNAPTYGAVAERSGSWCLVAAAAFAAGCWGDHALLARVLKPRADEAVDEHAPPAAGLPR
jgi:hypothetical protein